MKITPQTQTAVEAKFTIRLDEAALKPYIEHTFERLRGRVRVKGFRPGKAPDALVERELGTAAVQGEVMEEAVEHSYRDAVAEQKLAVVAPPRIELQKFVPYTELEFAVMVELLPEIKSGDYQAIRLPRPKVELEPGAVDQALEDLRQREASRMESQKPAKLTDEVVFDFDGTKGGQPVRGASAKGYTLRLGSGQFIPGFEEQLVGLKAGAEKAFDITFPGDYQEESLKGQKVTFAVKVHRIAELMLPELNDELAKTAGNFKTLEELKADLTEQLLVRQAETVTRQYENQVLDEVLRRATYELPTSLIKEQQDRLLHELEQNLAYSGLDLEKYGQMVGKTPAKIEDELRPEAERRVALALVLTEIAKAERIQVPPTELDTEITRLKGLYPDPATQAELERPEVRDDIYNHLMSSRVIAKLVGYADQAK